MQKTISATLFSCLLGLSAIANKIDAIKTDSDAIVFINSLLSKKAPRAAFESTENLKKAEAKTLLTDLHNWQKADLNNDGLTDLLVNVRIGDLGAFVIIDRGKHFSVIPLEYTVFGGTELAKIIEVGKQWLVMFSYQKGKVSPKNESIYNRADTATIDTLIYKFGRLVDYNPHPQKKEITGIIFETGRCFGKCPVFTISLNATGQAEYTATEFLEEQGDFKGKVSAKNLQPIFDALNYLDIDKLKNNYAVGWTDDATCWLTIKFANGSEKRIEDYGERGTFTLRQVYALLFKLRKEQIWYEK